MSLTPVRSGGTSSKNDKNGNSLNKRNSPKEIKSDGFNLRVRSSKKVTTTNSPGLNTTPHHHHDADDDDDNDDTTLLMYNAYDGLSSSSATPTTTPTRVNNNNQHQAARLNNNFPQHPSTTPPSSASSSYTRRTSSYNNNINNNIKNSNSNLNSSLYTNAFNNNYQNQSQQLRRSRRSSQSLFPTSTTTTNATQQQQNDNSSYSTYKNFDSDDNNDLVGKFILELMEKNQVLNVRYHNQHIPKRQHLNETFESEFDYINTFHLSPLFSRHNALVLRQYVTYCWKYIKDYFLFDNNISKSISWTAFINRFRTVVEKIRQNIRTTKSFLFVNEMIPKWETSLYIIFTKIIPIGIFTVAICANVVLFYASKMLIALGTIIMNFLVDWDDLKTIYNENKPTQLQFLTQYVQKILTYIDSKYLFGRRFIGREWKNEKEFEWDEKTSQCTFVKWNYNPSVTEETTKKSAALWDLPPPTVRRYSSETYRCLDTKYLHQKEKKWSQPTLCHVSAINFCYLMLEEEFMEKKTSHEKKQKLTHNKWIKNKTSGQNQYLLEDVDIGTFSTGKERRKVGEKDVDSSTSLNLHQSNNHPLHNRHASEVVTVISKNQRMNSSTNTMKSSDKKNMLTFESPSSPRESFELLRRDRPMPVVDHEDDIGDLYHRTVSTHEIVFTEDDEYLSMKEEIGSMASITSDIDLPWLDVGVKVGKLILNSAHVQRVITSQETTDRLLDIGAKLGGMGTEGNETTVPPTPIPIHAADRLSRNHYDTDRMDEQSNVSDLRSDYTAYPRISKPIHPMWTSPAAAGSTFLNGLDASELDGVLSITEQTLSPLSQTGPSDSNDRRLPPLSPGWKNRYIPSDSRTNMLPQSKHCVSQLGSKASNYDSNFSNTRNTTEEAQSVEVSLLESLTPPRLNHEEIFERNTPLSVESASSFSPNDFLKEVIIIDGSPRAKQEAVRITKRTFRRSPLQSGVKVAVPLCPLQPDCTNKISSAAFVMGTVVSSQRITVRTKNNRVLNSERRNSTNCLSVTVKMEKFFLRNGEFAELTFRVMDEWGSRYMPRHSKVPVGSCVATMFGIGVLVGWRVEDDCHVVRSLWNRRGAGSAHAYLNRHSIYSTIEAAIGFRVQTKFGSGEVLGCIDGGATYKTCKFFVSIREEGDHKGKVMLVQRNDVLSCHGAQFIPVTEHLREAINYQIQVDSYYALIREQRLSSSDRPADQEFQMKWTVWGDILWSSLLKAVEDDKDFDSSFDDLINAVLDFLEKLDKPECEENQSSEGITPSENLGKPSNMHTETQTNLESIEPGFWIMNDLFGGIFTSKPTKSEQKIVNENIEREETKRKAEESKVYDRVFGVIRILMKTVTTAHAASVDHPHLRLALAISYDFLLFVRTVVKVQQENFASQSLDIWKRSWEEIVATFGPIKDRLERIGRGIAQRMQAQGRKAKVRVLKFADKLLCDERVLIALEGGDWDRCLERIEIALVEANVIEYDNVAYYRKAVKFVYNHIQLALANEGSAASRNSEKLALFARFIQSLASPRRSILKLLRQDDVLELFERILIRSFCKEEIATRMLTIHAANFHTLRHLRMLKYFPVSGRIWIPLLDAADEEFSWLVSKFPENSKEFLCPLASLFSLCVAQFHKINAGDLSKDWLAFLLDEDAAHIIHDIDMKLLLGLESFSRDIRDMMVVLPYYSSIDDDILNLMDEVNIDEFVKEVSDALDDPDLLVEFIRSKATIAIERFLNYLPKLSIPVDKRELGDGWVLTCRGEDGGDLTLSDVNIKRENLVCQIMGGDTLFFPMLKSLDSESVADEVTHVSDIDSHEYIEESVLDQIRELITNAQKHGCWRAGVGGVGLPSKDPYIFEALHGLPLSAVLSCAIDLWRNLQLDDDELMEIAIRDVSYQIQLEKTNEDGIDNDRDHGLACQDSWDDEVSSTMSYGSSNAKLLHTRSSESNRRRFNPRVDPTVLYLEIKRLKLNLENFQFRIEKNKKETIFDPVFEGVGMLSLENVTIRLRIECTKEKAKGSSTTYAPILQLKELDVHLEKLRMKVKDTGFGSDWILNKAVDVFEHNVTRVVEENLKDQIHTQIKLALENLNSYFVINPAILLNILGIAMDDLDDSSDDKVWG